MNDKRSIIIIKSIVQGGPAEETGGLDSGDELVSVNGVTFDNVALDVAVQALKATPKGMFYIMDMGLINNGIKLFNGITFDNFVLHVLKATPQATTF